MGFWSGYRVALKPLDIEEPIDVYTHRPVGYALAKLAFPTSITPDQITVASILVGVFSGVLFAATQIPHHLQLGAFCLFFSAALDCADGMLARLRKSSSAFGRMIDGVADLFTISSAVLGTFYVLITTYWSPWWHAALVAFLAAVTVFTSSFHSTGYDHYKNVYMRFTIPGSREGEDLDAAIARHESAREAKMSFPVRITFAIYIEYLKAQRDWIKRFDPFTTVHLDAIPPYDEARAAIYRKHAGSGMRIWRYFFGVGSLVFGLALFNGIGRPDLFLLWRLVVLNGIFHLYLKPLQRRGSRRAFAEMGLSAEPAT
jgi:phosphatidylglycerophosphate synthase